MVTNPNTLIWRSKEGFAFIVLSTKARNDLDTSKWYITLCVPVYLSILFSTKQKCVCTMDFNIISIASLQNNGC